MKLLNKQKEFKTNELFWDLMSDVAIKERMAQLILTECGQHVDSAKISLAELFMRDGRKMGTEAWKIIAELNDLSLLPLMTACRVTKTVWEV